MGNTVVKPKPTFESCLLRLNAICSKLRKERGESMNARDLEKQFSAELICLNTLIESLRSSSNASKYAKEIVKLRVYMKKDGPLSDRTVFSELNTLLIKLIGCIDIRTYALFLKECVGLTKDITNTSKDDHYLDVILYAIAITMICRLEETVDMTQILSMVDRALITKSRDHPFLGDPEERKVLLDMVQCSYSMIEITERHKIITSMLIIHKRGDNVVSWLPKPVLREIFEYISTPKPSC